MENSKKQSKAQLEKKIADAIVMVPKEHAKTIHLEDRGITFTVTDDYTVISTNYNRSVFTNFTSEGLSVVYYQVNMFIDTLNKYKALGEVKDDKGNVTGFRFDELMSNKDKIEEVDLSFLNRIDQWSMVLTEPMFALNPTHVSSMSLHTMWVSFLSKSNILLESGNDDVEYYDYFTKFLANIRYMTLSDEMNCDGLGEVVANAEKEVLDKIKAYVESKGKPFNTRIVIPKRKKDEE